MQCTIDGRPASMHNMQSTRKSLIYVINSMYCIFLGRGKIYRSIMSQAFGGGSGSLQVIELIYSESSERLGEAQGTFIFGESRLTFMKVANFHFIITFVTSLIYIYVCMYMDRAQN